MGGQMITLGLDIGSNSVGSAWVDTRRRLIGLGVGVFPAGVEQSERKRGRPVNQTRREKRQQRHSLARRAERKRRLRRVLTQAGLLPSDLHALDALMDLNPWHLRRKALSAPLTPHEFGRVLVHLNQRRGALGITLDPKDKEEGPVKQAMDRLCARMKEANAPTFGQFIADLMDKRKAESPSKPGIHIQQPVRNRQYRLSPEDHLYADRQLIREEFSILWNRQKSFNGPLADLLGDELKTRLDDPSGDETWRHHGIIFGQRRTYWDTGTLGRCDLEPTDERCPLADIYAQEYRVVETVNNIRIEERGKAPRPLRPPERDNLIAVLRSQKTASAKTVRRALGLDKKALRDFFALNIERDKEREINTDWFYREIVHGAFTEPAWRALSPAQRDSVNRAILNFDPDNPQHRDRLRAGATAWWGLSPDAAETLLHAWETRPRPEKRVNLSRRAIRNLLPYMNQPVGDRWLTQIEARLCLAEDAEAIDQTTGRLMSYEQRQRYSLNASRLTRRERLFLRKHPDLLPPAPMLSNPVVRKAIHEVRRQILAYLRKYGRPPDRIIIELAKAAKQTEKVRNKILANIRKREKEKKEIIAEFGLSAKPLNQQRAAVERVTLCRQQKGICPYTNLTPGAPGKVISEDQAAQGRDVEIDHIVPLSRSQDNFLSNKVLCCREANRGKGNRTPKEWLTPEQFTLLEQRMAHWEKEFPRKWENLHRDPLPEQDFLNSQLAATAYAAEQVGAYLSDALYGGERDGLRRVFFTKGTYTAMLRKDWQLFQSLKDADEDSPAKSASDLQQGGDPGKKNRGDHRHHAIDAAVTALTGPEIIQDVARLAAQREEYHERTGYWPKREPLPPPWGDVQTFRAQVMERVAALVVSHRPVKRRISGALHEETAYGPVLESGGEISQTNFSNRIPADQLTPNHLRMPPRSESIEKQLASNDLSHAERRAAWRKLRALTDQKPGKSGIVRDLPLRLEIRRCLRQHRLDPDHFSEAQMKDLVTKGNLRMRSGMPIKSAVLLRTINDPVLIPRKVWDPSSNRMVPDHDPRTRRVYIGGNNHHIEIREDKRGRWHGEIVTTFEAARRVRCLKRPDAVDRSDRHGMRFGISLAEGETLHMKHPKTGAPGYFVVFKLDKPQTIHFIHHWDARPSKATEDQEPREDIPVTASNLRALEPQPGRPPYKVRVDPHGSITPLKND